MSDTPQGNPGPLPLEDNPERRCLWCGKRLVEAYEVPREELAGHPPWEPSLSTEANKVRQRAWEAEHRRPTGRYGQYQDNAFCGQRCGRNFGLSAARDGHRRSS